MTRKTENMAVLFADICGSTALYEKLGDNAARLLVAACLSLTTDAVSRHRGRVVKTIGDAAMCVFQRTVDAVLGATEIQQEVSSSPPENHLLQLHMGLHCGPVLVEKGDVYGDVVNAAAYLTAMATAEQILTTDATERQLSPQHKGRVRPVFRTVVKGSAVESTVYQVVWHSDDSMLTDLICVRTRRFRATRAVCCWHMVAQRCSSRVPAAR